MLLSPRRFSRMRRGTTIFLLVNFIVLGYLVYLFSTLISLLFENGSADAILSSDIPAPGSDLTGRPQLIPKIIHQTYINSSIPKQWKSGQQACIDLHPDYEYKVRAACMSFCEIYKLTKKPSSGLMRNRENL